MNMRIGNMKSIAVACFLALHLLCAWGISADGDVPSSVKFNLIDNRIFVNVELNGQGPFHFIFDTGAGATISLDAAKKLGLVREKETELSGVGDNAVRGYESHLKTVTIGSASVQNIPVSVISFADSPMVFGHVPVDGYIGQPFYEKYVVLHDYAKKTITFRSPATFQYTGSGELLNVEEADYVPVVRGMLDGISARFGIDTGARSALLLFGPFVRENRLRETYKPKFSGVTGWGIGGPVRSDIARVRSVTLGATALAGIVARFSQNLNGGTTDNSIAGLVGPDILKQFTMIYDLPHKHLILEKNSSFGTRDTYDKAGLWLIQGANTFEILDVISDGPASRAGLKVGDKILAIDGRSVKALVLPELRDHWKYAPAGTRVRLKVQTKTGIKGFDFSLEEMI
jgi:Aspartyl protease/PDZ domain